MDIDFKTIVTDFKQDLLRSFPEYRETEEKELSDDDFIVLKEYCKTVYPERFFDILYQRTEMFLDPSLNTCFLPGIEFKDIWKEDITDTTKETIWKYLQLILFNIVADIEDGSSFGDTSNLFEAMLPEELQDNLKETMNQMRSMFDISGTDISGGVGGVGVGVGDLPKPEDIQDHISGILDGKLGRLAKEIAEETAEGLDINAATNVDDIFKKLLSNPNQMMDMVKNVGEKLDEKIKSGDLKESELMAEATELVSKMKSMPGMENLKDMMGGLSSASIFQQKMKQQMNMAQMRERMKKKKAQSGKNNDAPGESIMEGDLLAAQEAADTMMRELLAMETSNPKKKRKKKKSKR